MRKQIGQLRLKNKSKLRDVIVVENSSDPHTICFRRDEHGAISAWCENGSVKLTEFPGRNMAGEFQALYPPEGAPLRGFWCKRCGRVTRTQIGIQRHLWRVHKIKIQLELPFGFIGTEVPLSR